MRKIMTIGALGGRITFTAWIALVFILIDGSCAIYAENNAAAFTKRQRPPVNFLDHLHETHMDGYECLTCHHRYEDNENVLDESELEEGDDDVRCASCHHSARALRQAFHDQCIGCHDAQNDAEGTFLPVLCGDCHTRRVD